MTRNPGKPASPADLRALDIFEFATSGRQAAGALRISQMPRMLAEVPSDVSDVSDASDASGNPAAGEDDTVFTWQAEGSTQPELQDDGVEAPQPYLRLAVHGSVWLRCQRCLSPYSQHLDVDATYRIVATEEEADEYPLDDDEVEVIVGSRQFDLIDLIEEELLLSLPLVPKHTVCPEVHESLLSGSAEGSADDESEENSAADAADKPNPFAVLEKLKPGGSGGGKH
ncbi:YceD family protein [Caballeronia sp. LZ033]|uniref:YceD family protein n=1 Tax=Caballeronia sp. LZ033 TaxID=3038566 RepID=UPI00286025FB|nr:YceD family protein [Caballeronia sp. LZ033]MDR5814031.1 YceD family protein [Caballeronia sp. LZ033]